MFPNHFFRERSRLCRGPFRDCSSYVLLIGRESGKGEIGKIPGPSPSKSGKSRKNRESPKKDKKGQKKEKSRSGNPPFETPPFSGPWKNVQKKRVLVSLVVPRTRPGIWHLRKGSGPLTDWLTDPTWSLRRLSGPSSEYRCNRYGCVRGALIGESAVSNSLSSVPDLLSSAKKLSELALAHAHIYIYIYNRLRGTHWVLSAELGVG